MAETHHHPFGTTIAYGPVGGTASIAITDVQDIEPPDVTHGESDDTTLTNTNAVGTSSAGWGKPGEAKIKMYLLEPQYVALLAKRVARGTLPWLITYATDGNETAGATIGFNGWIKEIKVSKSEKQSEEKIAVELTIHMTGDITFAVGSPAA